MVRSFTIARSNSVKFDHRRTAITLEPCCPLDSICCTRAAQTNRPVLRRCCLLHAGDVRYRHRFWPAALATRAILTLGTGGRTVGCPVGFEGEESCPTYLSGYRSSAKRNRSLKKAHGKAGLWLPQGTPCHSTIYVSEPAACESEARSLVYAFWE